MYLSIVWVCGLCMLLQSPAMLHGAGVDMSYDDIMEKIRAGQTEGNEQSPTAVKSELEEVLENSEYLISIFNFSGNTTITFRVPQSQKGEP